MAATYDLLRRDHLNDEAAAALRRCASTPKALQYATGLSRSRVHQMLHGDNTGTPQRFFQLVDRLARCPRSDPYPLLADALVIADEVATSRERCDLVGALIDALERETRSEAEEDIAEYVLARALADMDPITLARAARDYAVKAGYELADQLRAIALARVLAERLAQ